MSSPLIWDKLIDHPKLSFYSDEKARIALLNVGKMLDTIIAHMVYVDYITYSTLQNIPIKERGIINMDKAKIPNLMTKRYKNWEHNSYDHNFIG